MSSFGHIITIALSNMCFPKPLKNSERVDQEDSIFNSHGHPADFHFPSALQDVGDGVVVVHISRDTHELKSL